MENLTNEQIVDIINFYKMCGISEDMYLSRKGVLDLFSLIGISPEFDEQGNRLPTVYEQLEIPPVFRDGKEAPIVFAIKHKVSKVYKPKLEEKIATEKFTYSGAGEKVSDKMILNKLKQDYFSAVVNGNLNEATRIYDIIDKITGGKADYFIAVQYNCVKFYKKMQKQLLMDMFANFVILMILNKKYSIREGLVKFNKLYKAFVQKQLESGNFGLVKNNSIKIPEINKITISISEDEKIKASNVKADVARVSKMAQTSVEEPIQNTQTFASFIKEKIGLKLNRIKRNFEETFFAKKNISLFSAEPETGIDFVKNEQTTKVLESDK